MDIQAGNGGQRPRMLMCYLCGREFGSKSLPIHQPQCQKKWEAANMAKDPKDRTPMPLPPAPEIPIKKGVGGAQAIDDFNEVAYEQFKKMLESCPYCQRKFRPEAYIHHRKACSASNPAKPAGTALTAKSLSNNKLLKAYTGGPRSGQSSGQSSGPALAKKVNYQGFKQMIQASSTQKLGGGQPKETLFSQNKTRSTKTPAQKEGSSLPAHAYCEECGAAHESPLTKFCGACGTKRGP